MPAYLLVLGKAADRDRMAAYSRALPPIYSKYRGRYLALGGAGRGIDWLAGPVRDRSLVLARFDAVDDVLAFWWSEDYRAASRLRERAGQFTVLALPGEADVDRAFAALAEGGEVKMAPTKTFWSARFGMVQDRFGLGWMVTVAQ